VAICKRKENEPADPVLIIPTIVFWIVIAGIIGGVILLCPDLSLLLDNSLSFGRS